MRLTKDNLPSRVKVDGNGCWKWQGAIKCKVGGALGYGWVTYNNKQMSAHRASWLVNFGEIPKAMCVCHKCDVPDCVNPEHLFLGTHLENMRDMQGKGRRKLSPKFKTAGAKLSAEHVLQIKDMLAQGVSQRQIAAIFSVCQASISLMKNGRTWRSV
jgi:hypothetical protein